ncbi:MAG: hypothetical protein L0099_08505, partial [Acidobacteria bacterium]|nr:hypothetical protein [Acidobacteriota bacterium]
MPLEASLANKICQHTLLEGGTTRVSHRFGHGERPDKRLRQDQIAKSQRRKQQLREGTGVDHTPIAVEPL